MKVNKYLHQIAEEVAAERDTRQMKFSLDKCAERLGFERVSVENSMSDYIYIHTEFEVVLKVPFLIKGTPEIPPHAVETLVVPLPNPGWNFKYCFIQPLVDVSKAAREYAINFFETMAPRLIQVDLREENVGVYQGEPVLFDW